ncbi:hypothetical protein QTN25_008941 [Entamoeba marina]
MRVMFMVYISVESCFFDVTSEWINDKFDVIKSSIDDSSKLSVLECNAFLTRDKIAWYFEEQCARLQETNEIELKSRFLE